MAAEQILFVVRGAVALSCGAFAIVAVTHWGVTRGYLSPFNAWSRGVRRLADPLVRRTEHAVVARGGDPRQAPYWLLGVSVIGGLVLVSFTQWILRYAHQLSRASDGGTRGVVGFFVFLACDLLSLALVVRAIGSWFGIGRWTRWMRPFHQATDWMVLPLQRVIPPIGAFDVTPLVAWLILNWPIRLLLERFL